MEYVGRKVKKDFEGRGTFFGSIQAHEQETGIFKIVYENGDSEELDMSEVSSLLVSIEPSQLESTARRRGRPKKRRRIVNKGNDNSNSVSEIGISDNLVTSDENLGKFDLNLNEELDLNEDGFNRLNDDGGGVKLKGLDLNQGVTSEMEENLNNGAAEESFGAKKEIIDLNMDVSEEFENLGDSEKERCFDLNLQITEDEVKNLDNSDGLVANGGVCAEGDVKAGKELADDDSKGSLASVGIDEGDRVLNMENGEDNSLKNCATDVGAENRAPQSSQKKKRGRKRKDASSNDIELATPESLKVDFVYGETKLEPESREETEMETETPLKDGISYDNGNTETVRRGRRGRKRKEAVKNEIPVPTPGTGLRRSSRRAKIDAVSGQGQVVNEPSSDDAIFQLSPSPDSPISDQNGVVVAASGISTDCVMLPPKVVLPPSSCNLDLDGVSAFDIVSVYAFLRSFSTLLFLSPFELDDFVKSVKSNDSTLLFDSIHVSLLRSLRKHLEFLSNEGSDSASDCLRSLNWDFLDLLTWPMFVVEYLLLHSPGYIPGLDACKFKPFQNGYYKLPVSAKLDILRHLCDDVIEVEAFRSELNRRSMETDQPLDLERNVKLDSSKKRKATVDVANTSCITDEGAEESADGNIDECCLCKMDGSLICCDGCPAAFHSRCVGVISNLLPEGDWFCPECAIEKDKPWMKLGKSIRGAELLGIDPYERLYYSSCGYLLVLDSCNDKCSFWSNDRNDLVMVIAALESSPYLCETIINAICEEWNIVREEVEGIRNDLDAQSYSMQSSFPEKKQLTERQTTSSEMRSKNEGYSKTRSSRKLMVSTNSSYTEFENATATLETDNHRINMESHLASSEGSAEVSQTLIKSDTKETGLDNFHAPGVNATFVTAREEKKISLENQSYGSPAVNSQCQLSRVPYRENYVNHYELARTAASYFEEFTSKSSTKTSEKVLRTIEEIIAGQVKVVSNRFAEFSWSNIQNSKTGSRTEKCGWCFFCRVPEEGRDCLFIMNNSIPAVGGYTDVVLGVQSRKDSRNHLFNLVCHIICIEDNLHGLLLGPWLNPQYSMLWRKKVLAAVDVDSLKELLLKLESNLHHLAISAEWRKHADSVSTMGSASHIVSSSVRGSSKLEFGRKRSNPSKVENTSSSNAATGLGLFWWRGGRFSRMLFSWKVLPRSLASKAARQGGCKKIPGILYPDSGEYVKRTKCTSWRAAVESSRSEEQLALQLRDLDANIKWDDIGNNNLVYKVERDPKKPARSFKKVIIRRKSSDGAVIKYLLDFGKRRFIPDVVVKNGSMVQDSSSEKKKYWLEESHVPLYLLKAFEDKRIARKSNTGKSGKLQESNGIARKPFKKKGFSYLFSRAERSENYLCGHCKKVVLISEAVSCQHCEGFFHKKHVRKSAQPISAECRYTCHKCHGRKFMKIGARKGKSKFPRLKNASGLKPLASGKGKKRGRPRKLPVNSKSTKKVTLVVPLRRSSRTAARAAKHSLHNTMVKKRKKGKYAKSGSGKVNKPKDVYWKKNRAPVYSSFWLNGIRLLRKPDDERSTNFRSRMLVLSNAVNDVLDKPKCSLCAELEYNPELNYVTCEICGVWFHGDALGLTADKIENIIGFKCHVCLNKRPPVCPHHLPTESRKADGTGKDENCSDHFDDRSTDNQPEKLPSGSMTVLDQKDKDVTPSEKILMEEAECPR